MPPISLILLHGLGANGSDMQPIAHALHHALKTRLRTPHLELRIHCPDAPARPVSVNGGHIMPAWFDLYSLEADARVDSQGIEQSRQRISALLAAEHAAGVPWRRIILGGFSQGGVIALHCALQLPERLGGVLALSTWLPDAPSAPAPAATQTPVFIAHGEFDDLIPLSAAARTEETLGRLGCAELQRRQYPVAHGVSMEEIDDIAVWLTAHFSS